MSLWKGGSCSVTLKGTQRSGVSAASGKRARNLAGSRKGGWGAGGPGPGSGRGPELKSLQEGREQREPHAHLGREGRCRRLPLAHRPVRAQGWRGGASRGGASRRGRGQGRRVGRGRTEGGVAPHVSLHPPSHAHPDASYSLSLRSREARKVRVLCCCVARSKFSAAPLDLGLRGPPAG